MGVLLAAEHPERVGALIAYASVARTSWAPDYDWALRLEDRERARLQNAASWGEPNPELISLLAPSMGDDPALAAWFARTQRLAASPGEAQIIVAPPTTSTCARCSPASACRRWSCTAPAIRCGTFVTRATSPSASPARAMSRCRAIDSFPFLGDSDAIVEEVEEFLTGGRTGGEPARSLLTVMFTDIVDATARAARLGDRRWRDLLAEHDQRVREQLTRFGGRAVKTVGDGFLATFAGPPSQRLALRPGDHRRRARARHRGPRGRAHRRVRADRRGRRRHGRAHRGARRRSRAQRRSAHLGHRLRHRRRRSVRVRGPRNARAEGRAGALAPVCPRERARAARGPAPSAMRRDWARRADGLPVVRSSTCPARRPGAHDTADTSPCPTRCNEPNPPPRRGSAPREDEMRSLGADLAVHRMREMLERDLLGPAEPAHQEDLETLLDVLRASIELEGPCDYAEGPHGRDSNRQALQAHFAGLADPARAVGCRRRAGAGSAGPTVGVAGEAAAARGIVEPPFAVGALIDRLAVRTVERSRTGQSEHPHELSIQHFKDVFDGQEHLSVYVEGQKVARLPNLPEADMRRRLEATEGLIQGLFDDAQQLRRVRRDPCRPRRAVRPQAAAAGPSRPRCRGQPDPVCSRLPVLRQTRSRRRTGVICQRRRGAAGARRPRPRRGAVSAAPRASLAGASVAWTLAAQGGGLRASPATSAWGGT